jgi:hypothetical protein
MTSAANLVTQGVGIIAKFLNEAAKTIAQNRPSAGHRRVLLEDSTDSSDAVATTALDLYDRMEASSTGLLTLTMGSAVEGRVANGGSADLCASVLRGVLDDQRVESRCDAGDTSGRRLLQQGTAIAAVVLPSDFNTKCASDPTCSTTGGNSISTSWLADPATVLAVLQSWPATSILGDSVVVAANSELTPATGGCCWLRMLVPLLAFWPYQEVMQALQGATSMLSSSMYNLCLQPLVRILPGLFLRA